MFPEYWPAHRLVLFSDWWNIPRDRCANVCRQSLSQPPFPRSIRLLLFWLPSLAPASKKKRKRQNPKQDRDEKPHCTHRAEFGRPQIRDSGRLVMIRGSGWVMGSKDDRLFPSLPIQRERKKGAQRHGGGLHIPSAKHRIMGDNRSIHQWNSQGAVQTNVCRRMWAHAATYCTWRSTWKDSATLWHSYTRSMRRAIALPTHEGRRLDNLGWRRQKSFLVRLNGVCPFACFIYLLLGGKKKKRWQICVIEICCCTPGGAALFNDSMCGTIFAGSHSGNPFLIQDYLLTVQTECPQRPQCIE